jgi:hypothetical protein
MSELVWNKFLTERDKVVFAASGYGARGGFVDDLDRPQALSCGKCLERGPWISCHNGQE